MTLYDVELGENAIAYRDIEKTESVYALFKFIAQASMVATKAADAEGYALIMKEDELFVVSWIGFGEDSKIMLDWQKALEEIIPTLSQWTYALDPKTKEPLNYNRADGVFGLMKHFILEQKKNKGELTGQIGGSR